MLYLIDGYYYLYSSCYAPVGKRLTSPSGEPTTGTYVFTTEIFNLLQKYKPQMIAVALDSKTPTYRNNIYEGYKGNRRDRMPEDIRIQLNRIQDILTAMNIKMFQLDGYEADDIIGTITAQALKQSIQPVIICSKDKDFLQLINANVLVLELKSGKFCVTEDVMEKWGVWPEQFVDFLALQGDAADNIPGVPGIGAKTASKLLQEHKTVENLCSNIWKVNSTLQRRTLAGNIHRIAMNKKLVTINQGLPIYADFSSLRWNGVNKEKLTKIFEELGFKKLLNRLEKF